MPSLRFLHLFTLKKELLASSSDLQICSLLISCLSVSLMTQTEYRNQPPRRLRSVISTRCSSISARPLAATLEQKKTQGDIDAPAVAF
ncbi:hypothetical protein L596_001142 [Steinernema carpocapsae]|uniref:Uncharacterized protein n=1 Tax=Steinernema carpocapsae TaxID=34508 RepID=A0A4U8UPF7_STECR|nr:hypothetical protein L596_001142 [Steinernema carpocapsae]